MFIDWNCFSGELTFHSLKLEYTHIQLHLAKDFIVVGDIKRWYTPNATIIFMDLSLQTKDYRDKLVVTYKRII